MLNTTAIDITDIKPAIPRYQLSRFSRLQAHISGDWVRYCDHTQALTTQQALYKKATEQTEVLRDQLQRMIKVKDNYHTQATKMELDNATLRKQINKLEWSIPLIIVAVAAVFSFGTYFLTH
jgi:predicted  nucleic acid-binding Zn-ribbon protein